MQIVKNPFVSENGYKFTTKDFDKQYISFNPKDDASYVYFGEGCAWKSKTDLYAYLRAYRAEIFKGYWQNQFMCGLGKRNNIMYHQRNLVVLNQKKIHA